MYSNHRACLVRTATPMADDILWILHTNLRVGEWKMARIKLTWRSWKIPVSTLPLSHPNHPPTDHCCHYHPRNHLSIHIQISSLLKKFSLKPTQMRKLSPSLPSPIPVRDHLEGSFDHWVSVKESPPCPKPVWFQECPLHGNGPVVCNSDA